MEFNVTGIAIMVGILNEFVKRIITDFFKKDPSKIIPICSMIFGIVFGLVGHFIGEEGFENIVSSIFIGMSAGGMSTCAFEIYRKNLKTTITGKLNNPTDESDEEDVVDDEEIVVAVDEDFELPNPDEDDSEGL